MGLDGLRMCTKRGTRPLPRDFTDSWTGTNRYQRDVTVVGGVSRLGNTETWLDG